MLTDGTLELTADFARDLHRVKRGNLQRELLVRAAKIKRNPEPEKGAGDKALTAVDATAGFGEDSLLLAAAGFSVTLFELNPVIAALLQDALRRVPFFGLCYVPASRKIRLRVFRTAVTVLASRSTPDSAISARVLSGYRSRETNSPASGRASVGRRSRAR